MLRRLDSHDAVQIARLHVETIRGTLSDLGFHVLHHFYRCALYQDGNFAWGVFFEGGLAGFVMGTLNREELYLRVLRSRPFLLSGLIVARLLGNPRSLIKVVRSIVTKPIEYDSQLQCELVYISVQPGLQGKGFGYRLIEVFEEELRKLDIAGYELSVDRDNTQALEFYTKNGLAMVFEFTVHGISRCRFSKILNGST